MNYEKGIRVGAILEADEKTVRLLGYGTYQGDEIPPANIMFFTSAFKQTNPKIVLDNGKVVWGCECWWGPEQQIKKLIGHREVVTVDIDEVRKGVGK